MNLIKPRNLKRGDTIGIIALSGAVDEKKILSATQYFKNKGFKVKLGSNLLKKYRDMAGNDKERLDNLHSAFLDDDIDAIICARGGYGALRLINEIDYELIKTHPKIFCGYSDVTVLNALFMKRASLITFSGPMVQSDFSMNINNYTESNFFKTLEAGEIEICPTTNTAKRNFLVEGITFGGNLATLSSLCGTDFIPDEKFIFFTEDINEPAYKIDRYFTQLLNIEQFKNNLAAIVCGEFSGCDDMGYLSSMFKEYQQSLNIEIVTEYPISHGMVKATVPYGAKAQLTANNLKFSNYLLKD